MTRKIEPQFGKWEKDKPQVSHQLPKRVRGLLATPLFNRGRTNEWDGYRKLAKAVLLQAAKDANKGDNKAKEFLQTPSHDLDFWREVAEF